MLFSSLLGWVVVQFARLFFPLKWEWNFWVEIVFILRYESGQQERGRVEHYCESIENLHFHIFHSAKRKEDEEGEMKILICLSLAKKKLKIVQIRVVSRRGRAAVGISFVVYGTETFAYFQKMENTRKFSVSLEFVW